jgi:hypothetical protein
MRVKEPGSLGDGGGGVAGGAGDPADWNMRVNAPGSLDDGDCGAGTAGAAGAAPAVEDWKSCVNSPAPAVFCGAGAAGGLDGAGAAPESALNICVKLLGASEGCGGAGEAAGAGSAGAEAGFSMETWRKMLATPASGAPGDLKVCSILVNSPAAEEARTTGGVAGAGGGADTGAGVVGAAPGAGGPRRDARRSSSLFCATGWPILPKAPVMLSGSDEPDAFSPGTPGAPKGVLDSLIEADTPEIRLPVWKPRVHRRLLDSKESAAQDGHTLQLF